MLSTLDDFGTANITEIIDKIYSGDILADVISSA